MSLPVLHLSNVAGSVTALIAPAVGSNLFSLQVSGRELLRRPPDADSLRTRPTGWGIPVLMPPNRVAGGRFRFAGREYRFPINNAAGHHIHGLVAGRPWTVESVGRSAWQQRVCLPGAVHVHDERVQLALTGEHLRCGVRATACGQAAGRLGDRVGCRHALRHFLPITGGTAVHSTLRCAPIMPHSVP